MTRILSTAIICFIVLFSPLILAGTDQAPQLEQRLEQAKARLGLTDGQVEQMAPVLQKSMEKQQSILSSYGIDLVGQSDPAQTLGVRKAMAMKQELDVVRADTLAAVEDILTDEQFDEFKRLQRERQAEMRERIRGRR
jgi:hypothetical protein